MAPRVRFSSLLVLFVAACAATRPVVGGVIGGTKDTTQFPTAAELQAIKQSAKPELKLAESVREVSEWKLAGPLASSPDQTPITPTSLWEKELAAVAAKHAGVWLLGRDMQCAARELGRFYLDKGASPVAALADFVGGRCGSVGAHIQIRLVNGEVPTSVSDQRLVESWREAFQRNANGFSGAPRSIGVFYGRKAGKAVILVASAERLAALSPRSFTPAPNGVAVVEGELLQKYDRVAAHVNQGEFGYAACTMDLAVLLPKFRFECPTLTTDATAWIDVSAWQPGRFLGSVVAGVLALPGGGAADVYVSNRVAPTVPGLSTTAAFLDRTNAMRRAAKLAVMALEEEQSALSVELVPLFFAAQFGEVSETYADKIALGVMAGWSVRVPIVDGDFSSTYLGGTKDPSSMVNAMLARPHGRETLLKPSATRLAIGVMESQQKGLLGAIVASYVPGATVVLDDETDVFIDRVNRERAKRSKAPITAQTLVPEEEAQYRIALASNHWSPRQALEKLLEGRVSQIRVGLRGWEMSGASTATMAIPAELLNQDNLVLTIVVGKQRPPRSPWERVVTIVTIEPTP